MPGRTGNRESGRMDARFAGREGSAFGLAVLRGEAVETETAYQLLLTFGFKTLT